MRILIIGGFAVSLLNFRGPLLKEMIARGHEVIACAPNAPENVRSELSQMGVTYRNVPISRAGMNPLKDINTSFVLLRLFRSERPDIVLAYTAKPVIWGCIAARIARVPAYYAMITGLGYAFMDGGSLKQRIVQRLVCMLYRTALAGSQAVFFQNPDDRLEFQHRKLLKNDTPAVLINGSGVDTKYFSPAPLPDNPTFLLMARLIADKGIREYREAARRVKAKYPHTRCLLAGGLDTNPSAISHEEIAQWQEEGHIEYMGNLEDVRPALTQAQVYVLPSYYREGTPRTILEALSTGRAIITTDAPGCRETVERLENAGMLGCWDAGISSREINDRNNEADGGRIKQGKNGFLVPIKDADALTAVMEKFITQPDLAESMGRESRRIAEENYDVHKVNRKILKTIGL